MASLRNKRRKQCLNKVRHISREAAVVAAENTNGDVRPYMCNLCGSWHVGHKRIHINRDNFRYAWAAL